MTIAVVMLVVAAGLSTAQAQTSRSTELRANIPFEFSVGNQTMPAGEYTVQCTNPDSSMKVLQVRSRDGHASALIQTNSVIGMTQEDAKLVFNRYDDQYFFAQAWLPADSLGMQVPKSRSEKQTARELAGDRKSKDLVAITARR